MKGDIMSESGLAKRDDRRVLRARGVAGVGGYSDDLVSGRCSEYGGRGDVDRDQARPDSSGLVFALRR